jgi:[acyl-carrier-protein] S-malonyltransferase
MLPVSAPFHSSLLQPAAERLAQYLQGITFESPRIRVVNNVDVRIEEDPQAIKAALARQACKPVRWVEVIRAMSAAGASDLAECGPGKVLAALTRRIESGVQSHAISDPSSLAQTLEALK